ncbi:MAG: iron-sulfur cluster assembly scaffold protein [Ktedonobacterales bacterium]|nr:iron-sulfur cluster assembly scaffold protein [Ktedonobacterales bacterium]
MDRQEAIEFLVDHYQHPRNRGALADADITLTGGNPGCADTVIMYAKVAPDGRIEQVSFEGEGCTISMAAASYVTELVRGMTLEEVERLSFETLIDDLGREVVMARPTCATVALGTLKQGAHELRMQRLAQDGTAASKAEDETEDETEDEAEG